MCVCGGPLSVPSIPVDPARVAPRRIKNLILFGFTCYRRLALDPDGAATGNVPIQVPSGADMPVRFSAKHLRWVPDLKPRRRGSALEFFEVKEESSDEEDDDDPFRWHVICWMPPTERRATSFAAQAYSDSYRIEELYRVWAQGRPWVERPSFFPVHFFLHIFFPGPKFPAFQGAVFRTTLSPATNIFLYLRANMHSNVPAGFFSCVLLSFAPRVFLS